MENINLKGDYKNPEVSFDAENGLLELKGKAVPERAAEFFLPLLNWIDAYIKSPAQKTTVNFKLEYCNSSSTRYVMDMLEKIESLYKSGHPVTVNWYYEEDDESMFDLGESYCDPLEMPINMIEISAEDDDGM